MRPTRAAFTTVVIIVAAFVAAGPALPGAVADQKGMAAVTREKPLQIASANWRATVDDIVRLPLDEILYSEMVKDRRSGQKLPAASDRF